MPCKFPQRCLNCGDNHSAKHPECKMKLKKQVREEKKKKIDKTLNFMAKKLLSESYDIVKERVVKDMSERIDKVTTKVAKRNDTQLDSFYFINNIKLKTKLRVKRNEEIIEVNNDFKNLFLPQESSKLSNSNA